MSHGMSSRSASVTSPEPEAQEGEQEDRREGEFRPHVAGRDLDVEAEALIGADELRDRRADSGVDGRILDPTKHWAGCREAAP